MISLIDVAEVVRLQVTELSRVRLHATESKD